jgi:hypothetical protein
MNEVEGMWKEAVMVCFEVPLWHSLKDLRKFRVVDVLARI